MTNLEKYFNKLMDCTYVKELREEPMDCYSLHCDNCKEDSIEWLKAEYVEPKYCDSCIHSFPIKGKDALIYCEKHIEVFLKFVNQSDCKMYESAKGGRLK